MSMQDEFNFSQQLFSFPDILTARKGILTQIVSEASALPNAAEISADIAFVKAYISGITIASTGNETDFTFHMWNILTAAGFSPWASTFEPLFDVQLGLAFPVKTTTPTGSSDYPLRDAAPGKFDTIVANVPNLTPAMQARMASLLTYYSDTIKNNTVVIMADNTNTNKIMALLNAPQR